jgi:hypothetical protein
LRPCVSRPTLTLPSPAFAGVPLRQTQALVARRQFGQRLPIPVE